MVKSRKINLLNYCAPFLLFLERCTYLFMFLLAEDFFVFFLFRDWVFVVVFSVLLFVFVDDVQTRISAEKDVTQSEN